VAIRQVADDDPFLTCFAANYTNNVIAVRSEPSTYSSAKETGTPRYEETLVGDHGVDPFLHGV
jgi:hypothetical protein